ncbi:MAG: ABC transporter permease [Deltaproteobacteria bacterium]|nr:MAG: ABC transporter permease [Deltaproteobacteria bacterium]
MSRLASQLRSFVRTALRGLRASPLTTAVSVATIAITLVLIGSFVVVVENMQGMLERFGEDLHVSLYLEDGLSDAELEGLAERVETVEGVDAVELVSKEQALQRFEAGVGARTGLLEALEENPLPASLEVTLLAARRTPEGLAVVIESIDGLPGIAEVAYGQQWVETYARAVALVRGAAFGLGAVLALAAFLIVANTIRLAVYARSDELEIVSLVGGSRTFVNAPFLLEGMIQGGAGAALALVILYALFRLLLPGFEAGLELLVGYAEPAFLSPGGMLRIVLGGAALGAVGSAAALAGSWRP